jgi:hypothetical protein
VQTEATTEKLKGVYAVYLSQGEPFSILGNFNVRDRIQIEKKVLSIFGHRKVFLYFPEFHF